MRYNSKFSEFFFCANHYRTNEEWDERIKLKKEHFSNYMCFNSRAPLERRWHLKQRESYDLNGALSHFYIAILIPKVMVLRGLDIQKWFVASGFLMNVIRAIIKVAWWHHRGWGERKAVSLWSGSPLLCLCEFALCTPPLYPRWQDLVEDSELMFLVSSISLPCGWWAIMKNIKPRGIPRPTKTGWCTHTHTHLWG